MMELLRQWLLGTAACALLVGALERLCPEGSVRQAARFTGGLLLLCVLLRAPAAVEQPGAIWDAGAYRAEVARLEQELRGGAEAALADGIAAELAAYIEDKAARLGADVCAEVSMGVQGGVPVPEHVTLRGGYSAELSEWLAEELGVTKERQAWMGSG